MTSQFPSRLKKNKEIINNNEDRNNFINNIWMTAAYYGKFEIILELLKIGMDINIQENNSTALMYACCDNENENNIKTVQLLLDNKFIETNS